MTIDGDQLDGVSATTLWTLRNRAVEAMRQDALIDDPLAIRLYEAISHDYDRFGKPNQTHTLRTLAIDRAITDYLAQHRKATVVALGEGLQTSYWRLGSPDVDWLSVDLEPVIELRKSLLPDEPRITSLAMSALANGVFITVEGLFMYLDRAEVMSLITDCAKRFPGGQLFFDSIPKWLSDHTLKGLRLSDRYTAPPMPFSFSVKQAARLPQQIPGIADVRDVLLPFGRGIWKSRLFRVAIDLPVVREWRPSMTLLSFA
jgi:O-methyltransferase involved in polyketide biosynthesis